VLIFECKNHKFRQSTDGFFISAKIRDLRNAFAEAYPEAQFAAVNTNNYYEFI